MFNECFGNKPLFFSDAEKQCEFWGDTLLNFNTTLLHQEKMAFPLKVYIVVPVGLNIDGLKSFFPFIFISIYNLEINLKLLNLSLSICNLYGEPRRIGKLGEPRKTGKLEKPRKTGETQLQNENR